MIKMLLNYLLVLLSVLTIVVLIQAQDQSGFISIDCGLPKSATYTEPTIGINYISDDKFISSGVSVSLLPSERSNLQQQLWHVRSFPNGVRNCYRINVTSGTKYLIRADFYYGNYDGLNEVPIFDLHIGANPWDTVKFPNASLSLVTEIIHSPPLDFIHICLVNTGRGTPFISSIELRALENNTYGTESGSLDLYRRYDLGSTSGSTYRYSDDVYDRIWMPFGFKLWTQTETSTLPPIMNAIEIYIVKDLSQPETEQDDVDAITNIKKTYGVDRNWQGDPCAPIAFMWEGLNCSFDGEKPPRITYLDLSSIGMTGQIPSYISNLTMLQYLNLGNNKLNGSVPTGLVDRSKKGSLSLRILGRGGFGPVYHGFIDGIEVAVKMLSQSSVRGYQQFLAEVKLLMIVHHRNLTSLVGYCNEEGNIGLIYEYMANGNLDEHLSGKNIKAKLLTWEDRLRIAIDAAQGLEYLHNGCKPPIIHRDVKCTNILLNENLQAKVADFGLSKSFSTDGETHLSTVVAGTHGYMDPDYAMSNRLTEKSDVYSFGVVILVIITGQPAIIKMRDDYKIHISQWVIPMISNGDIENIVDSKLEGDFDTNSVWKAVEIAMACLSNSSKRPNMSEVVTELKGCFTVELARKRTDCDTDKSSELVTLNLTTEFGPSAR
ncbi:hypothetical protein TanjilG_00335 [Lupinus angustifolius]|uniref:non-specific serine/threonine protein kinase n=1 Tax=Lupinus angustifolius TaxID=3871 RepID=A0A394D3X5_LUPAN|nr:hypothetical protein TanjilG_00335 [Lupinus angustifolius]